MKQIGKLHTERSSADRFMLVYFTEPSDEGGELPDWPQHMTVTFYANGNLGRAETELRQILGGFTPFQARVAEATRLGQNHDVPAWLLEPTDLLQSVHEAVLHVLNDQDAEMEETEHTGSNYRPHITPKLCQPPLAIGDTFLIDRLTIVRKQIGGARAVYKHLRLGHETAT